MMRKRTRNLLVGVALLTSFAVVGCGVLTSTNSEPQTQPTQVSTAQGGGQSIPHKGQNPTAASQQQGSSTTVGKGKAHTQSGSASQPGSTPSESVTIHVGGIGGTNLISVPVSTNGTSNGFVPVAQSVTSVKLPVGWTMQSNSYASSGTTVKWINLKDPSQYVSESIQTFTRDLGQFYTAQSGSAKWLVPNQVVQFELTNPNNPNPDMGVVANISSGGSIRLDVYLPASEHAVAQQVIDSFVGIAGE